MQGAVSDNGGATVVIRAEVAIAVEAAVPVTPNGAAEPVAVLSSAGCVTEGCIIEEEDGDGTGADRPFGISAATALGAAVLGVDEPEAWDEMVGGAEEK